MGQMQSVSSYDWKPDLPDPRDVVYHYNKLSNFQKQIDIIDLRGRFTNETKYNTTTSNCIAMVLKYLGESDFELLASNSIRDGCKLIKSPHKIVYNRIQNTIPQLKRCIIDDYPILFGLTIYQSTDLNNKTGIINMPSDNDNIIGGICGIICGFDIYNNYWIVKTNNPLWGDNGCLYVPMDMLEKEGTNDFWRLCIDNN
jgi:hypothetical protein